VPFFPVIASSDDRTARGCVPVVMRNCFLQPQAEGASKRTPFFVGPTPGLVARVVPSSGKNVRGLFCRPGVQSGNLFAACGDELHSINTDWVATDTGATLGGTTGRVLFDGLGANALALANNTLTVWNGTTPTNVNSSTDPDFPSNAYTLASLADRALTSAQDSDQFDWSGVGDATSWPSTGFAASARLPDPIVSQIVLGGDLWHHGKNNAQVWRAVGGSDADAFDLLSSLVIDRGIIGRDAIAKLDSSAAWIGEDRVAYELNGYAPSRIVNRDLELALRALSDDAAANIACLAYSFGSHLTWLANLPDSRAFAFDMLTRKWHERTTFGQDGFAIRHYARFGDKHVVASDNSDAIYTWEDDVYSDAGTPIERVIMLHVPFQGRNTPVSNITLDMKTFGQPVTGQGSAPVAMVSFSRTGGSLNSIPDFGIERMVSLGAAGQYGKRPTLWRLGAVNAADGLLLRIRITDPVGFALSGVWVNELPA
jgi:hypothetical protein